MAITKEDSDPLTMDVLLFEPSSQRSMLLASNAQIPPEGQEEPLSGLYTIPTESNTGCVNHEIDSLVPDLTRINFEASMKFEFLWEALYLETAHHNAMILRRFWAGLAISMSLPQTKFRAVQVRPLQLLLLPVVHPKRQQRQPF